MILYPTIELQNGRCVSLYRGRIDEPQIWHVDPVEKAREFSAAGAQWLHVTDLDAVEGGEGQIDLIDNLIARAEAPIQLAGGFRSMQGVAEAIERGAGRVVVGTLAVLQPNVVKAAAKAYPDQIVLAVDVYQGKVMTNGWRDQSTFLPEDFIETYASAPLAAIAVSDIDADLDEAEDSLALVTRLAGIAKAPVIARGLAHSLDDLSRLKYVPNISGAMIGRALFNKNVDISDAIDLAESQPEPKAEFI